MNKDLFYRYLERETESFLNYCEYHKELSKTDMSADDWFQRFCEYIVLTEEIPDTTREPQP